MQRHWPNTEDKQEPLASSSDSVRRDVMTQCSVLHRQTMKDNHSGVRRKARLLKTRINTVLQMTSTSVKLLPNTEIKRAVSQ